MGPFLSLTLTNTTNFFHTIFYLRTYGTMVITKSMHKTVALFLCHVHAVFPCPNLEDKNIP